MKLITFILLAPIFFMSCDTPQRTRTPYQIPLTQGTGTSDTDNNGNGNSGTDNVTNSDTNSGSDNSSNDNSNNNDNNDSSNSSTTGFEDCNLEYQYFGNSIGYFGLCQNSESETKFKLKMASSDSSLGTCFVPLNIQNNNNSFNVGIAECVHNEANKDYDMTLTKNRSEAINGIMVIKANALNAFMQCMSAKTDFINAYAPTCAYDTNCLIAAENYAASVCNQFVQTYSNYYLQVQF